ncbi:ribonuclease HII [Fibrobacter sp.]|uniref:ribonuclease HII n=1 Tax=Fibrobacter sp. TaxID=35828 RepID=UPI0025C6E5DF|nr:ribonuclease HII [Fibrobacter sp.]MBR2057726.1 ribonuclease HII [Fibrobacter sp.]MBR4008213.1 ribonuclease HII [Fibrobacter sp.]
MKFKLPAFLENVKTPVEGETLMRKFVADPASVGGAGVDGSLDLFASAAAGEGKSVIVVGIDEVGRGPLAGPVVACAAVLKAPDIMPELNDSKKLSRKKREAMFDAVKDACACYAIASASEKEIDEMNILEADFLAMRRALQALGMQGLDAPAPEIPVEVKGSFAEVDPIGRPADSLQGDKRVPQVFIAVDGNLKIRGVPAELQMPVVKGDGRIASISAASILAKVFRDRYMDKLAEKYPAYGFEKNAGYPSPVHLDAIRKFGFTPVHRRSFHVKELEGLV